MTIIHEEVTVAQKIVVSSLTGLRHNINNDIHSVNIRCQC